MKINPVSGVLYSEGAVPVIRDMDELDAQVTVLVMDEDSLYNIRTFTLKTDIGNCPPKILGIAHTLDCLVEGETIDEKITIFDRDLLRVGYGEELTFEVQTIPGVPSTSLRINPSS